MRSVYAICLFGVFGALPLTAGAAQGVEQTLAAAHQAAHDDQNAKAAELFANAIAAAPSRRLEILPELADQLTYSGRSSQAVSLYREAVTSHTLSSAAERHAELGLALALSWNHQLSQSLATYTLLAARDPHDLEALLGQARVLSWQDQLSRSLRTYRHVLTLDHGNLEAEENIARVQTWQGRQREARRDARAILANHRGDVQASATLAQSELWMGRPDVAQRDNQIRLRTNPNDAGARAFAADINDAISPRVNYSQSVGTQSDGYLIRSSTFGTEIQDPQGLSALGFRYQPISYVAQNPSADTTEHRTGLFGRHRFNDWSEVNLNLSNDAITSSATAARNILLYNGYFTFWPSDTFRFDIGTHRDTFDNVTSLRSGITAVFDNASIDVTPDENTRLSLRADHANFSDGNHRSWEQVEIERAVVRKPRLSFGARVTTYAFGESINNGYFDPLHYNSAEFTTHLYGDERSRLYYDVSGSYGREWVEAGGTRPTHAIHGSLSYVLSRPLSLSASFDSFDTRQFSNGGFSRTVVGLGLQTRW